MNNACGKDVLLESVNIFWVSKRCVVVGGVWSINILRHLSHKQTNEREEFLNVQSSVLSKFGVEIPQEKKLILLATLQVLQKAIAIAFYCVCIHLL